MPWNSSHRTRKLCRSERFGCRLRLLCVHLKLFRTAELSLRCIAACGRRRAQVPPLRLAAYIQWLQGTSGRPRTGRSAANVLALWQRESSLGCDYSRANAGHCRTRSLITSRSRARFDEARLTSRVPVVTERTHDFLGADFRVCSSGVGRQPSPEAKLIRE